MVHEFSRKYNFQNNFLHYVTYKLFFYFVVTINFKINGEYCYNENVSKRESREFSFSRISKFTVIIALWFRGRIATQLDSLFFFEQVEKYLKKEI